MSQSMVMRGWSRCYFYKSGFIFFFDLQEILHEPPNMQAGECTHTHTHTPAKRNYINSNYNYSCGSEILNCCDLAHLPCIQQGLLRTFEWSWWERLERTILTTRGRCIQRTWTSSLTWLMPHFGNLGVVFAYYFVFQHTSRSHKALPEGL